MLSWISFVVRLNIDRELLHKRTRIPESENNAAQSKRRLAWQAEKTLFQGVQNEPQTRASLCSWFTSDMLKILTVPQTRKTDYRDFLLYLKAGARLGCWNSSGLLKPQAHRKGVFLPTRCHTDYSRGDWAPTPSEKQLPSWQQASRKPAGTSKMPHCRDTDKNGHLNSTATPPGRCYQDRGLLKGAVFSKEATLGPH